MGLELIHAGNIILSWGASTSPYITGYNVHYGTTSGNYPYTISVGNLTNVTISGLANGVTYYFVATAFNATHNESCFSGETKYTIPGVLAVTHPTPTTTTRNPTTVSTTTRGTVALTTPVTSLGGTVTVPTPVTTRGSVAGGATPTRPGPVTPAPVPTKGNSITRIVAPAAKIVTPAVPVTKIATPVAVPSRELILTLAAEPRNPVRIQFPVEAGHRYEIQATTDLRNWRSLWESELTRVKGSMGYTDAESPSFASRFYRLVLH